MTQKYKILIVDDNEIVRETLDMLLHSEGYDLVFAENGQQALEKVAQLSLPPDLILLDVNMPGRGGFEVCRRMRDTPHLTEIPIIFLSGMADRDTRLQGLEAGADDFLTKPIDQTELRLRIRNIAKLNRYRHLLAERAKFERLIELSPDGIMIVDYEGKINLANPAMVQLARIKEGETLMGKNIFSLIRSDQRHECAKAFESIAHGALDVMHLETDLGLIEGEYTPIDLRAGFFELEAEPGVQVIIRDISARRQAEEEIQRANKELSDTHKELIYTLGEMVETRSKETANHVRRVAEYSYLLGVRAGLSEASAELLKMASPLHDVGKIGIPDSILLKPGKLSQDEFEQVKTHTAIGYKILRQSNREIFKVAATVAHQHHERWNGKGYPQGLKGDEIHPYGRIVALIDVFDALASDRCYKKAWKMDRVIELIKEERGEHFEPYLVDVFLENLEEFIEIQQNYPD